MMYRKCVIALLILLAAPILRLPACADNPPSWLVGKFRGNNRKYKAEAVLSVNARGRVSFDRTDGTSYDTGNYRRGKLVFDNASYDVDEIRNGVRLTQIEDRSNRADYRRSGSDGSGDSRPNPPSWLVGTFRGNNRKYNAEVELRVNDRGNVALSRTDGSSSTNGAYRNGRLVFPSSNYNIERTSDGVRLIQVEDRNNRAELRRR